MDPNTASNSTHRNANGAPTRPSAGYSAIGSARVPRGAVILGESAEHAVHFAFMHTRHTHAGARVHSSGTVPAGTDSWLDTPN